MSFGKELAVEETKELPALRIEEDMLVIGTGKVGLLTLRTWKGWDTASRLVGALGRPLTEAELKLLEDQAVTPAGQNGFKEFRSWYLTHHRVVRSEPEKKSDAAV
jgi:hypothetical protein